MHVRINAKLVRMPQRTIVASTQVEHTVEAPSNQMDLIIDAFDSALGKVLKKLVQWTLITGDKAYRDQ